MARAASPLPRPRIAPAALSRMLSWFVALAALALIGISLGSFLYHRRQLNIIAAEHVRMVVTGPGYLQAGAIGVFNLATTTVTGEPWPAQIEWTLATPEGKRLIDRKERTDEKGCLMLVVPADMDFPAGLHAPLQLSVTAACAASRAEVAVPLPLRTASYITHLSLDRRTYRPGETVYFRSLTLSRFALAADRNWPIEFTIVDAKSKPLPGLPLVGLTDRGVGNGAWRLPENLPDGKYALIARTLDDLFPPERIDFTVAGVLPQATDEIKASRPTKGTADDVSVTFYPEGGRLPAGIECQVYVATRDGAEHPIELRGTVIDRRGDRVATVQTASSGLGSFTLVPDAGETYRLKINRPAGPSSMPTIPRASNEQAIVLSARSGVFPAGAPLEFTIRAAKDRVPLVVTARARGILVGQQTLVTHSSDSRSVANLVAMPLDDAVCGAIRLTAYDCTTSPPRMAAERLVFRQPRSLTIRAFLGDCGSGVSPAPKSAGETPAPQGRKLANYCLSVTDDKGRPTAAVLGVTVLDASGTSSTASGSIDLMQGILLSEGLAARSELKEFDLHLPDPDNAKLLDLVLGTQDLDASHTPSVEAAAGLPIVVDTLPELHSQYEDSLSEYRDKRTRTVNALVMLCFFGGLGLALLVTMLGLLRIVWGIRLWVPTVVATLCCVVVTTVSNDPSRVKPVGDNAAEFATYRPPTRDVTPQPIPSRASDVPKADKDLRNLMETLTKSEGDAEKLGALRFAIRDYAPPEQDASAAGADASGTIGWQPLVVVGVDGRAVFPAALLGSGRAVRALIDAHGNGRIDSRALRFPGKP